MDDNTDFDEQFARQLQAEFDAEFEVITAAAKHDVSDSDSDSSKNIKEETAGTSRKRVRSPQEVKKEESSTARHSKPVCKYADKCYRTSEEHIKQFDHSPSKHKEATEHANKRMKTSSDLSTDGLYFTKVVGIDSKYNFGFAVDIKDILAAPIGTFKSSAQFNYMFDIPWLVARYPLEHRKKPLLLVHGERQRAKTELETQASPFPNIKLSQAPLADAFGTHHTKMMLLLYDEGLRVVIHTSNLIERDWHQKSQGVWMSNLFPQLQDPQRDCDSQTKFKEDLLLYLNSYKNQEVAKWAKIVEGHDLSSTRVCLIGSVPGRHTGQNKNAFGHMKLRSVLKSKVESKVDENWPVIGQFSSIGSLGAKAENWVTAEWLTSLSSTNKSFGLSRARSLKLIFPSVENVRCSLEGYPAGASLPYSKENAAKQPWLRSYLYQWKCDVHGRSTASPHIKTYARTSADHSKLAWLLITSANLSKAAWGNLEKQESQLHIRSYELGVLFLPQHFNKDVFDVTKCSDLLIPFDLPPVKYESGDQPWVWNAPHNKKPDRHGIIWEPTGV